jgi:hypothetical protein
MRFRIAPVGGDEPGREPWSRPRSIGLGLVLVAGALFFASVVDQHYPLKNWLFFRYARVWILSLVFLASSSVGGYGIMGYLGGRSFPKREELALATGIGVFAFGLLIILLGHLGLLGLVCFLGTPAILVGIGFRRCARDWPRLWLRLRRIEFAMTPASVLLWALAAIALGLVYVQILTPEAFGFDERWYHVPMAQRYALTGRVARFEEGYWPQANPHLASYLYTWAFLTPGVVLFDRLELCVHLEFVLFLVTFAQIPLLARRLAPGLRQPFGALVMLVFPSLYLYDGNLHCGADHVAAFFAIPTGLAAWRCFRDYRPQNAVILALCLSALTLTKFTALTLVVPAGAVLSLRGVYLAARRRPLALAALATLFFGVLGMTTPLWLRNLIWFGDPVYPFLHAHLHDHPWNPDAAGPLDVLQSFMSSGPWTKEGLFEAVKTTLTFSFVPNDWYVFHRDVPIFGSLFTLTLPCLLFLKRPWRLLVAHACIMVSLVVWYMLQHQDRYLQTILPWMAATTAACFARIWQVGWVARGPLIGLVALQVVWGGDVPFFRTHNQLGDSPVRASEAFIATGFEKKPNRLVVFEAYAAIGKRTPENAVVLAHDMITILGIDRNWVTDVHESRFSYGVLRTPDQVHRQLKALGVTHLVWTPWALGRDTLASDFAFLDYALHYTEHRENVGGNTIGRLPKHAPPRGEADPEVALYACGAPYPSGRYRLSQLRLPVMNPGRPPEARPLPADPAGALDEVSFVGIDRRCHGNVQAGPRFVFAGKRDELELYVTAKVDAR